MEFFDLPASVKNKQSILDAVQKSLEGKRPQLPAYQLLQKLIQNKLSDADSAAVQSYIYDSYHIEITALDDEESKGQEVKYAPGAEDGNYWFHGAKEDNKVATISSKVEAQVKEFISKQDGNLEPLYNLLISGLSETLKLSDGKTVQWTMPVIGWIFKFTTDLLPWVQKLDEKGLKNYAKLACTLAFKSAHKTPVKIGIMLLGLMHNIPPTYRDELIDMVMDLGRYEEFTWYSCRLLYSNIQEPLPELWDMSIAVTGWGRILAIKVALLVANFAQLPKHFKHWLLVRGYHNDVMTDYTAFECIEHGDLLNELKQDKVDDDLLQGASELLTTVLQSGGPITYNLDAWQESKEIFSLYKKHVNSTPERKSKFSTAMIDK
jgi:hypothetical protein